MPNIITYIDFVLPLEYQYKPKEYVITCICNNVKELCVHQLTVKRYYWTS